jgi:integrase
MASIDKRPDGRYRARWREVRGGPQKSQHFARKVDAQQFLDGVRGDLARGVYIDPSAGKVTFKEFAEEWRRTQVHRPGTIVSVEQQLRLHVYPSIGDRPIGTVRASDVQALVRRLMDRLAPTTVEVVYGRVAAVFNAAVRDRVIAFTPCIDVKRPGSAPSSTLEVLTTEQVLAIAEKAPERYRALVVAGAGTGLRPGELFGLTVDRVDFLRGTLRVDQQLVRVRATPQIDDLGDQVEEEAPDEGAQTRVKLGPLKTAASYRTVPLPGSVGDVLAAHLARWPAHEELGLVFTNERDAPIQQHPFSVVWSSARDAVGVHTWATPHDLRHYYASLLIRSGASVKVVQSRLGHASAKTTLDTYGHMFPDEEDRTRAAVDDELCRTSSPVVALAE